MSRIKSALELAMEKTADVEADRGALRRAETVKKAKRTTARFLGGEEVDLLPPGEEERELYEDTVKETLLLNLKLPRANGDLAGIPRLEEGFSQLITSPEGRENLSSLFGQLKNFFAQYLDSQEQLYDNLVSQYEPQLRRKEAQLREQTGQSVRLTPEQDPEFIKFLQNQQKAMDDQYGEVIKQAKGQLTELL